MLTPNERKVLRTILTAFGEEYSINAIASKCVLSPNGAYKILAKFEKQGILTPKTIANIKSYKINFANNKTQPVLVLALIPDIEKRLIDRVEDLQILQKTTNVSILFGSYLSKKIPNDLDVFFVLNKSAYRIYTSEMSAVRDFIPIKVHDVVQTTEDLRKNLQNKDKVIIDILRTGIILWGHDSIVQVIKDVSG